jgi:hypothetical protein
MGIGAGLCLFALIAVSRTLSRSAAPRTVPSWSALAREPALETFASEARDYRKIYSLWRSSQGETERLNRFWIISPEGQQISRNGFLVGDSMTLADVIRHDSIDPVVYERFVAQLELHQLNQLVVEDEVVLLARRNAGLVHLGRLERGYQIGDTLPIGGVVVDHIGPWYRFSR